MPSEEAWAILLPWFEGLHRSLQAAPRRAFWRRWYTGQKDSRRCQSFVRQRKHSTIVRVPSVPETRTEESKTLSIRRQRPGYPDGRRTDFFPHLCAKPAPKKQTIWPFTVTKELVSTTIFWSKSFYQYICSSYWSDSTDSCCGGSPGSLPLFYYETDA